jgi:catechol 2,3-dioxygenase-like lactoylglutathione lyase family enzyme
MPQHLSALALVVRDYDEAIDYYVNTLGFDLLEDTDMAPVEPNKRWVRVQPPGAKETCFLLAKATTPERIAAIGNQTGGRVFLFLNTDDFWRDYNAYSARGVKWIREPSVQAYGTVAVFADLYGNKWDLIGPNDKGSKSSRTVPETPRQ